MQIGSHNCFSIFTQCKLWLDSNHSIISQLFCQVDLVEQQLVEHQLLAKVLINLT